MFAQLFRAALSVLFIATMGGACGSYEATDQPICGDQLLPEGDTCALWPAPCGCAADQKCVYDSSAQAFACSTPGNKGVDAPCVNDSECAKGTICDGTRCRQTCFEGLDCGEDEALICYIWRDAGWNQVAGTCQRDCDPVSPSSPSDSRMETCRTDEACVIDTVISGAACTRSVGKGTQGAACKNHVDCAAGVACIGDKVCETLCWPDGSSSCPTGKKCGALSAGDNPVTVLGRALGVCE